MAVIYLEPDDLTPAQAARVLDFLNRAGNAQEIASRIEIPGELDIGVKLGQRLLDARAALGGRFTDLKQVDAVPLIGHERFTELCSAILGLPPKQWVQDLGQFAECYSQFQAQLAALEKAYGQVRLDITASPQPSWLGQCLDLVLHARAASGQPLANRVVTVEASLGTLTAAYGFAVQRGRALTVRTGSDGTARLRLCYDTIEPLTADQQVALEDALGELDAAADSPHLIQGSFSRIAATYQDERAKSLRAALDIYSRQWKGHFFDQLNASNLAFHWPLETCVVRADCHPEDSGAGSVAQAVLAVHWKNWVGAWFEFLGQWLNSQAGLDQAFVKAKGRAEGNYHLVDNLIGEAQSYIAGLRGQAAEWVSQRMVTYSVNNFLGRELADVDDKTQRELFSYLEGASHQLTAAGRGTLAMVNQTRLDLDAKIALAGEVNAGMLEEVRGLHDAVQQQTSIIKDQLAAIDAARLRLDGQLKDFDSRYQSFASQYADFTRRMDGFSASYTTFSTSYAGFQQSYQKFSQDYSAFSLDYTKFNSNYSDFSARYNQATDSLNAFQQDYGRFATQYDQFSADYGQFRSDLSGFNQNRTTLTQQIGVVSGELTQFQADRTTITRELSTLKTDLGSVRADISGINTRIGRG